MSTVSCGIECPFCEYNNICGCILPHACAISQNQSVVVFSKKSDSPIIGFGYSLFGNRAMLTYSNKQRVYN